MRAVTYMAAILASLALTAAAPAGLAAQEGCTMKCACVSTGCGCALEGGNGESCTASGYGCYVGKCSTAIAPVAFAPNGGILVRDLSPLDQAGASAPGQPGVRVLSTGDWERTAPGKAVARNCAGIILAEWYAPEAAAELRAVSTALLL